MPDGCRPGPRRAATPSTPPRFPGISSTSPVSPRCRSASPGRFGFWGEHAVGDFYIPMATTEGTLVASYNRGMRLLTETGGVTTTVVDDSMQRAPVFAFDDARQALHFGRWVDEHFDRDTRRPLRRPRTGGIS